MKIALLTPLALLFACSGTPEKKTEEPKNGLSLKGNFVFRKKKQPSTKNERPPSPGLIAFKQSECLEDCPREEKIVVKEMNGDTLSVRITKILDCSVPYDASIPFKKRVLRFDRSIDFEVGIRPKLVKHKDGSVDTVIVQTDCDCVYYLDFKVKNVAGLPKTIRVNGKLLAGAASGNEIREDIQLR